MQRHVMLEACAADDETAAVSILKHLSFGSKAADVSIVYVEKGAVEHHVIVVFIAQRQHKLTGTLGIDRLKAMCIAAVKVSQTVSAMDCRSAQTVFSARPELTTFFTPVNMAMDGQPYSAANSRYLR